MPSLHPAIAGCVVVLFALIGWYVYFWLMDPGPPPPPPARAGRRCRPPPPSPSVRRRPRCVTFAPEPFDAAARSDQQQQALLFSDILVTEDLRQQATEARQDAEQIQSVNERFEEAKRNVVEHRLKPGVYSLKKRRKLVENLLRRPFCGRRVRSWRTENSDYLRGDVRPRVNKGSSNLIRSAKSNPEIDLHPGALGPVAGMHGRWTSEENVPANIFETDVYT